MKKLIFSFCSLVCALLVLILCHLGYLYTHIDHHPNDFKHAFVLQRQAPLSPPDQQLKNETAQALKQKFFFCGKGREMTAYESEDHRFVLKFFNNPLFVRKHWFHNWDKMRKLCSLKWFSKTYFGEKCKLTALFDRHQMAFDELGEESGILYVHLNRATTLSQTVEITDEKGKNHQINLEKTPFVLQKKVELAFARFRSLIAKGEFEKLEESISQLYDLFLSRAKKGFTDRVQNWHSNYGFVENRAVQIDLGRIVRDKKVAESVPEEMEIIFLRASKQYPELDPVIRKVLESNSG